MSFLNLWRPTLRKDSKRRGRTNPKYRKQQQQRGRGMLQGMSETQTVFLRKYYPLGEKDNSMIHFQLIFFGFAVMSNCTVSVTLISLWAARRLILLSSQNNIIVLVHWLIVFTFSIALQYSADAKSDVRGHKVK